MKTSQYISVSMLVMIMVACGGTSSSPSPAGSSDNAAVSAEEAEMCAEFAETHDHEAPAGFTAAANNKFHVKVDWSENLLAGELTNSAKVTFQSPHGEPMGLTLKSFKLFMPSMGHGTIKADKLIFARDPVETHVWSVSQIYFSMGGAAGEWVVDVEGSACGLTDKARVTIQQEVK